MSDIAHKEREHFFGSAKLMAGLTVVSRVLGMVRDMAIIWLLGASRLPSAFILAFKVPNLFRRLFGEGALSAAFVPTFTETAEKQGFDRAKALFANALGLLAVILCCLCALAGAGLLVWGLFWPGLPDRQMLLLLLGLMLPFTVTVCLLALGSAALNCRGHFGFPAFAPVILNIFMIAAAWTAGPIFQADQKVQLIAIACSVTIAGLVQLAGVLAVLRRHGFSIRPVFRPIDPAVGPMLRLMAPVLLGLGFLQLCELLNDVIAWVLSATENSPTIELFGLTLVKPLSEGVLAHVYAAQRLYQLPMGVLAVSLGVAIFPLFSRYAARDDMANLRESVNRAARLAMMEGLAAGTGLFFLARPIVSLIFEHGKFGPADAETSAFVLQLYCLGMWAYCTYQIFTRAFYSLKETALPLKVSCWLVGPNLIMVAALAWAPGIGPGAFGIATAATFGANTIILALLLRRRIGSLGLRRLAASAARSVAACGAMAGALVVVQQLLADRPYWMIVAAGVPAGAIMFFLAAKALRCPEIGELLQSVRSGGHKASPDEPDRPAGPEQQSGI